MVWLGNWLWKMNKDRPLVVKSYLSSLPARVNSQEKIDALTFFAQGAAHCGDIAATTNSNNYETCDVAAIIGNAFGSNPGKTRQSHYLVRKMIIDTQSSQKKYWLSIDSNVFIYKNKLNPSKFLRYSFNGVFPCEGIYCNENPTEKNWAKIQKEYNMNLRDWRSHGNHILIALQRPQGWSMRGINFEDWFVSTLDKICRHSDRPIRLRWHPGNYKDFPKYEKFLHKYIKRHQLQVSKENSHILDDLVDCWALVCHNSTPSSVASIEGIPAFITDQPGYCQAGEVANTDFSKLENPDLLDRELWIKKLAQCHWNFEDLKSGRCWSHMRQWVKVS